MKKLPQTPPPNLLRPYPLKAQILQGNISSWQMDELQGVSFDTASLPIHHTSLCVSPRKKEKKGTDLFSLSPHMDALTRTPALAATAAAATATPPYPIMRVSTTTTTTATANTKSYPFVQGPYTMWPWLTGRWVGRHLL